MSDNSIRRHITLVETAMAGETTPALLYHGTNPIAATLIHKENKIQAEHPVDDDGLGPVVCTTSSERVAKMFAIEFARLNSEYDVGFVFKLNGTAIAAKFNTVYHEAETASVPEFEYRVQGSIDPLNSYLLGVRIVGDWGLLKDDDFREKLYHDGRRLLAMHGMSYEDFCDHLDELFQTAA